MDLADQDLERRSRFGPPDGYGPGEGVTRVPFRLPRAVCALSLPLPRDL